MSFKNEWKDLQDATPGMPNSGDDISVEPINRIAHQVILNEENLLNKVNKEDGKGLSTNDFTDEYKEKVENSGKQVQNDWNQNDETAPDYIKNRTHYTMDEEVLCDITFENVTTLEFTIDGVIDLPNDGAGKTDVIFEEVINGEKHSGYVFGKANEFIASSLSDGFYNKETGQVRFMVNEPITGSLKWYRLGKTVPLDEKYIPDTIARVADVEEILDELHAYAQNLIGGDA